MTNATIRRRISLSAKNLYSKAFVARNEIAHEPDVTDPKSGEQKAARKHPPLSLGIRYYFLVN
jgi:hypothetical protein